MNQDPAKAAKARALVASLLFIETGVIGVLALWLIGLTFASDSFEFLPFLGVLLFALLGAGGLAASAIGYRRGKYYGRSPAVLANLIALGVAYYQIQGAFYIGAVIILVLALPTLYFAFSIAKNEG